GEGPAGSFRPGADVRHGIPPWGARQDPGSQRRPPLDVATLQRPRAALIARQRQSRSRREPQVGSSSRIAGIKETSLRAWYVPTEDTTSQARVPYERVAFLDAPPSDRQYRVIGYICPPVGK